MKSNVVRYKDLEGVHELSGVDLFDVVVEGNRDANVVRFQLDGKTYEAVEDPDDGYRSSLGYIIRTQKKVKNQFKPHKVRVAFEMTEEHELLTFFRWKTDKIVLQIGTDACDDYYPQFIGHFNPKNLLKTKKNISK